MVAIGTTVVAGKIEKNNIEPPIVSITNPDKPEVSDQSDGYFSFVSGGKEACQENYPPFLRDLSDGGMVETVRGTRRELPSKGSARAIRRLTAEK